MNDARRRDHFVGRIASEVKARRSPGNLPVERPDLQLLDGAHNIGIVEKGPLPVDMAAKIRRRFVSIGDGWGGEV